MSTIALSMHGPDGELLPLTHVHKATGRKFRILLGPLPHITHPLAKYYVLADESAEAWTVSAFYFDGGAFEYIPGGQ